MTLELAPWQYRARLQAPAGPFQALSPFRSTTVHLEQASPIIATALHHASRVRKPLAAKQAISPEARYYEEDPGTQRFLARCSHVLLPNQSRYEVDLNRPPDTAIYLTPETAWGVKVWDEQPTEQERETSLEVWYEFHTMMDAAVQDAIDRFGRAIVLDLHSYNYQRDGPTDWRTDGKPVINLGTRYQRLDQEGKELKDWFLDQLEQTTVLGDQALVQENAVFYGGYLNRRLARTYGPDCITLSVEYKKVFMDETSQTFREDVFEDLLDQFDGVLEALADRLDAPLREQRVEPVSLVG